jgi:hypothetical protein
MTVPLKKCSHPDCAFEFPEHYLHDRCSVHETEEDNRHAKDKARTLLEKFGDDVLYIRAVAAIKGMTDEDTGLGS